MTGIEGLPNADDSVGDDADHHGHDGGRDTQTAGEAQREMSGDAEQRLPAMAQNNAPDADKIAGIVAQTRSDVSHLSRERVVEVLTQRLEQTGIPQSEAEIGDLADQVMSEG